MKADKNVAKLAILMFWGHTQEDGTIPSQRLASQQRTSGRSVPRWPACFQGVL